ncbi:MAG: extracellular solute-binding protein, partial [Myxococcota bacterium]
GADIMKVGRACVPQGRRAFVGQAAQRHLVGWGLGWFVLGWVWTVGVLGGAWGCSEAKGAASDAPVKVVLWHSYRAGEQQALDQVIQAYNTQSDDTVVEALQIPNEAFADKLTAAIPRDNGPDIFIFAHDRVGDWAEQGLIEPVSIWSSTAYLQSFFPNTVKALVYKKSLYGLPMAFKSVVLYYNRDRVKSPPRTEQELLQIAKAHTDRAQKRYGLVYQNTSLYFTAPFIHGFGGQVLDREGNLQLTSEGTAKGLAFARELLALHKVVPEDVSGTLVTTLFNKGQAAMVINGPWFRSEISDDVPWGTAVLPMVEATGKRAAPFVGSEAVLLSRYSTHKEEAYQVMRFLAGPESSRIRMKVAGQPAAHRAPWDELSEDDPMRVFRDQLSDAVIMPGGPTMRAVWGPADQAIFKVVKDGVAPAEALRTAQERIEKAVR